MNALPQQCECCALPGELPPQMRLMLFVSNVTSQRGAATGISNPGPHPYHGCALPTELSRHEVILPQIARDVKMFRQVAVAEDGGEAP